MRITEGQLRTIIRQEVRALREEMGNQNYKMFELMFQTMVGIQAPGKELVSIPDTNADDIRIARTYLDKKHKGWEKVYKDAYEEGDLKGLNQDNVYALVYNRTS